LPDGTVLVVAGVNQSAQVGDAEIYDPASGTWSSGGLLRVPRSEHSASLLPDGRVLVAGGRDGLGALDGAEIYDPASGAWSRTGSLNVARANHVAVLLPGGKVLVAGGIAAGRTLTSAEVYDPALGRWTLTGGLAVPRQRFAASLLPNGQVLAVSSSAELYDQGLGFRAAWRPLLRRATSPLKLGTPLAANGSGFRGLSEAAGGNSEQSATNYPLLLLRRLDNEQVHWLLPNPTMPFSDTVFASVPVTGFLPGPALVTMFVNGIPSESVGIQVTSPLSPPPPRHWIYLPFLLRNSQ
jgi:hypothetical protein